MLEQGEGCIINVASASGIRAVAGAAAYAASKAALRHLTKCVALECAQAGTRVRVCSLSPGGVKTPIWEELPAFREVAEKNGREAAFAALAPGGPLQGFLEADAVAEAAVGLVKQSSLTACDVVMDGGWSA
jgi:NAD(P)-dependent dehydrogenase (short-subunit alcohol dehydrogenase family)